MRIEPRPEARLEFDRKTKVHALVDCKGMCCACGGRLSTGYFHFDHIIPAWYQAADGSGCQVLCIGCHKRKTKEDLKLIAKSKRIIRRHKGIRKPRTIRGWRRFDGTPVKATEER